MDNDQLIFSVEDEEEIRKLSGLPYPAVTLTRSTTTNAFSFNKAASAFFTEPNVKVSRGKIRGEYYIIFRPTPDRAQYTFNRTRSHCGNVGTICASRILDFLGMAATNYRFQGRRAVCIPGGIAVPMYERANA